MESLSRDSEYFPRPSNSRLTIPDFQPSSVEQNNEGTTTPRNRGRSRSFSQVAIPFISPTSEKTSPGVARLASLSTENSQKPDKARQETRKLLSHILNELQNRPRPPSIWDAFKSEYGGLGAHGPKGIRKSSETRDKANRSRTMTLVDSDSDDEISSLFSPDITFDFLNKLKEVLIMSKARGWHIFNDGAGTSDPDYDSVEKPSFRFRRSSFQSSGRRSRSFSPGRSKKSSSELLSQCISILRSIVNEDCRFQVNSLRLARPPNALQALTLDVSQILVHLHRGNAKILYDIGLVIVPAFSSFPGSMHGRLLRFFEDGLLRSMLQDLNRLQNGPPAPRDFFSVPDDSDIKSYAPPIVAIQVDEAQDDSFTSLTPAPKWQQWLPSNIAFQGVLSPRAPAQSLEIYYLSSVIGPLVTAILDNVDLMTQDLVLSHRIHKFFSFLADCKPDTPFDLLEVVAYHSAQARYFAACLLQTFWPKAFGHLCISKPFPLLTYSETLQAAGLQRSQQRVAHPHFHQFVPWHFSPAPSSVLFEGSSLHDCHSCSKQIVDFGLLCPFCMCAVHANCYDSSDGTFLSHYPVANERSTQRVAVHRFSYVRPHRLGFEPEVLKKDQHAFRLANVFTLSLCGICHLPLWGYFAQGYRCASCNQYVHTSCLHGQEFGQLPNCHSEPDTSRITITWALLRSSFVEFYYDFIINEEDIDKRTHEEMSMYWSLLWIQLQLLKYGIASGSVIVTQTRPSSSNAQEGGIDNFELQHHVKIYETYLGSGRLRLAPMLQDLLQKNSYSSRFVFILFDWPILLYITSLIKSTPLKGDENGNNLLNVAMARGDEIPSDLAMYPADVVPVAHLRDALACNFGLEQNQAACIMLGHLRHLGFYDSADLPEDLFLTCDRPLEVPCSFFLPLGLDISPNVESLVVAVESCLQDLDISVNESGFLLLTRKLWPNGMASDYAQSRLTRAVLAWVLSEDDNLVIILREYVAKNKNLPGVPLPADSRTWPNTMPTRSGSSGSVNNGNDYVTCRKHLLTKYATRWLFALHCQNPELYISLLFETVTDIARDTMEDIEDLEFTRDSAHSKELISLWADKVLRFIMKICQSSLAFSVVDDLLLRWLNVVPHLLSSNKPISTLARLFNRDAEGSVRWTSAFDATITSFEHINDPLVDPWRIVISVASRDYDGLRKGLNWLRLFALSGVDIPVTTFLQISALARDLEASFEDHVLLGEAAFMAIWIKSLGRQDLQKVISDLHDRCGSRILERIRSNSNAKQIYRFVRLTLSSFLLLYGCERARLQDLGLVETNDIEGLTSRRKVVKRASFVTDSSIEDIDLIEIIWRYVEEGTDELRCLISRFLTAFVTETSLLSSQELETFMLKNSYFLTRCAWELYDIHAQDVNDLRTTLLLRILVVDTRPFEELLKQCFDAYNAWENRLAAATQLFQIILDVTKPSFLVEGRQWRSSVMEIFYRFFSCIWFDEREEIRLAADAWAQSLQPAHYQSMALCFSESLTRAPISDRLKLVTFLLQLRSHFPTWKVLSWDVIIETLMDDVFMQRSDADEGAISAHLSMYGISTLSNSDAVGSQDPDVAIIQSSLVLLSLQMIADGIPIDIFSFLKIKLQLVAMLGFTGTALVPAPSGHSFHVQFGELKTVNPYALPCVQGLMALLDASRPFEFSSSALIASGADDDTKHTLLAGSVVVDVFLGLFNHLVDNLQDFPYLQTKTLLQTLVIVIYKHDIESTVLRHLREQLRRAMKSTSDLLLRDVGYELRQLALTAIQAFRKKWLAFASSRDILLYQVMNVIKLVSSSNTTSDDILIGQAMNLLEDILTHQPGTLYNLSKQSLEPETFTVLRLVMARNARNYTAQAALRDIVLRDTLHILVHSHNDAGQKHILENLWSYIELVHHQGYSSDNLTYVGESFIYILRNASELTEEGFDPNPLLLSAALLIQHNKAQIRGFLHHIETVVRIALARFNVSEQAMRRLFQVTSTLYRRAASESGVTSNERNSILTVAIDILSDGLRGKCRVTPQTLKAIMDSLCSAWSTYLSNDTLPRLASDAFYFLQHTSPIDNLPQHGLNALISAGSLILCAGGSDVGFLSRHLNEFAYERSGRHALAVRAWNVLVLQALQTSFATDRSAMRLFSHLSTFSAVYHTSLWLHGHSIGLPQELTTSDVNQAFIALKLWSLLARKCSEEMLADDAIVLSTTDHASENRNILMVWNELWPPFERLVSLSEADAEAGDITPIATLVWTSVADIFLFLRIMRSTISLESMSHIAILNGLRALSKGESSTGKFARTLNSISEPPPEMPMAGMLAQIEHEMLAAEKLHALETRREIGRIHPDRSRRDLRMPTG
ncbi:hypothetical protein DFH11DRAFT_1504486 [Phellopilus nigrolimitatus]|nr:hypothetical protein DFH11DRAFT_1504486 [Phellopilus nigrolimitatus]